MKPYGLNAGRVIYEARQMKRLSQKELSFLTGYKNGQFISNIERGLCNCPPALFPKLVEILSLDPASFKEAMMKDICACLEYDINKAIEFHNQRTKEVGHGYTL
jgi:transcriptional regulator with XRE-family HTH domain